MLLDDLGLGKLAHLGEMQKIAISPDEASSQCGAATAWRDPRRGQATMSPRIPLASAP